MLIFDGHGLSHQRMMGIATMAGILLNKPSIGCAKSHLYGDYTIPGDKRFSYEELKVHNLVVGYVLRSKERVKPIFISTGFAVSPEKALEITINLLSGYKLPLPAHYAHYFSEDYKRSFQ
jgi:deoxyribonuclease V